MILTTTKLSVKHMIFISYFNNSFQPIDIGINYTCIINIKLPISFSIQQFKYTFLNPIRNHNYYVTHYLLYA